MESFKPTFDAVWVCVCANWTFIIIVFHVIFLTTIWFSSGLTYAFQSHQKIGLFSILNFHTYLLWHFAPFFAIPFRCFAPSPSRRWLAAAIVVTSVLRIHAAYMKKMFMYEAIERSSAITITERNKNQGRRKMRWHQEKYKRELRSNTCCQDGTNRTIHKSDHMK